MLISKRIVLMAIASVLSCSAANAQFIVQRLAEFGNPNGTERRFTGGREVEFTDDGLKMIVAFYGSIAQLFDLSSKAPIGEPISTAGDGEVGFVNNQLAYTADWNSVRLWDNKTGRQVGDAIRHELREDTIIHPAISPQGKLIATRATMKSVQLLDVTTRKMIGKELEYSAEVHSIRFSEDGKLLFVGAGGWLHAINSETGENVADPIKSGWQFYYFPKKQKLVTTEPVDKGLDRLVIRSTDQTNWPVTYQSDLSGTLTRIAVLDDHQFLLQTRKADFTPAIFVYSLDNPDGRMEVVSTANRAFDVVVTHDKRHWICNNTRDIRCQKFTESKPLWQKQVPLSGYDQHLHQLDNEHFIILDKQENLGVYKVADGNKVWDQTGVKRFSLTNDKIALCNSQGVAVWVLK